MKMPTIMGILNITPDSFSDGGKYNSLPKAITKALQMEKEGADIIDLGGESSGPNSKYVSLQTERKRIMPILKELKKKVKIPISVDTYKSKTAEEALKNGASIINDVTGLRGDKNMAKTIAKYNAKVIIMYSKDKTARTTIKQKKYKKVMNTICDFFEKQITYATKQGIKANNIIIDPGLGHYISAIPKYSFDILSNLKELKKFNKKILIGVSRKSFLGNKINDRDEKTVILNAIAYLNGAGIIRVHNVKKNKIFFNTFNQ